MKTARKHKTPQEVGKGFEEQFRLFLKHICSTVPAVMHRFYDTHSAGSIMPTQPGDFQLVYRRHLHLFELKSSEKHQSLASGLSSLVDLDQMALMNFWHRGGAVTHYLFLSQQDGAVELWDGGLVCQTKLSPRARLKKDGEGVIRYASFEEFCQHFADALRIDPRFSARG